MARAILDHVIWEMGQAFDMLYANLKDLRPDDWLWLPDGGVRTISAIVGHVASVKVMYDNHAFGDASLSWEAPLFNEAQSSAADGGFSPERAVEWLRESQFRLLRNIDALADDGELLRKRPVTWGSAMPTRWIIHQLIQHDGFHAGEVNHLRAIHQRNDRWEWEQES